MRNIRKIISVLFSAILLFSASTTSYLRETLICKKNKTSHLIDIFLLKQFQLKVVLLNYRLNKH